MIAISSFKPFPDCAPEIASNQITAFESWAKVFDDIVYLNDPEPRLSASNVTFVPSENWPRIQELVRFASMMDGWTAIINADIVVITDFLHVEHSLKKIGASCAMSQRYEFVPLNPVIPTGVIDLGLDIFCATPEVWKAMLPLVPDSFRIGHQKWDTWCLGFMNEKFGGRFFDFTPAEVIYHPKHGNRKFGHEIADAANPWSNFSFPARKII